MTAPYTQDDLESMLADLESDLVERKESLRGDAPRNFGQPGLVDYRNPILAEAMRIAGLARQSSPSAPLGAQPTLQESAPFLRRRLLAQRYGAGIPTARRALRDNHQGEPEFRVEQNWVHCTVRART